MGQEPLMPKEPRAWQRMLSGRRLDLLDPSPRDVELSDTAHGVARVARWNGETPGPHVFSVAQHSLLVEAIAGHLDSSISDQWKLAVLLHDAPEYVIGDIISPFKAVVGDAYKAVEARLLGAIHLHFGLPPQAGAVLKRLIKRADQQAAYLEATRLAGFTQAEATKYFGRPEPLPRGIGDLVEPMPTATAQARFLERVAALQAL